MIERQIDGMLEQLALTPEDWTLHSVLADALEDVGRSSDSDCIRWLGRNRKRPQKDGNVNFKWMWYDAGKIKADLGDSESNVPSELYAAMDGKVVGNHKGYDSHRDAVAAVISAWGKAVAGGWEPVDDPTPIPEKAEANADQASS